MLLSYSCVHYSCDAIDCQKPMVHNAEMKCSSPGYFNGVRCAVTCNHGYTLKIHRDDEIIKTQVLDILLTCMFITMKPFLIKNLVSVSF